MINSLYKASNSLLVKIIIGIIILSFILSGMNGYLIRNNYVAKVNGQEISAIQLEKALENKRFFLQQQLGDKYLEFESNRQYIDSLKKLVLNSLIDKTLLNLYAKKLGLYVSDEQVKKIIFSTQEFQSNGKFDNSIYNSLIKKNGMSINQYIQNIRDQLVTKQLIEAIISTDFFFEEEIKKMMLLITQQRIIRQLTINIKNLINKQQVNYTEINNYYEQNKNTFIAPEQFCVSYIALNAKDIQENVSDVEVESYYNQYYEQFNKPQRSCYSVIRTKSENNAKLILNELHKGKNFAEIAKLKSIDIISAKNGGNIGWLKDSEIPDELRNAKLKKKGQISNIIKCSTGYLIVRLDDIELAKTKPLNKVRNEILMKIKQKKALSDYNSIYQKVDNTIKNDNTSSLSKIEQITGTKAIETDWFSLDNLPKNINFKPAIEDIFNNKKNISTNRLSIIKIDNNRALILRINKYKPKTIKLIKEVQNQIIYKIKYNKALQQAKVEADEIISNLKNETLKIINLKFSKPKKITRNEQDPISQMAFKLSLPENGKPSYGITNDTQGNLVLLLLEEVTTSKIPESQKKLIIQDITTNKIQIMLEALINDLRKEAKIEIRDIL